MCLIISMIHFNIKKEKKKKNKKGSESNFAKRKTTVLAAQKKMTIIHLKSLMLYFLSYVSLCIITIRSKICVYGPVGIYVTDIHKQIELLAFFF